RPAAVAARAAAAAVTSGAAGAAPQAAAAAAGRAGTKAAAARAVRPAAATTTWTTTFLFERCPKATSSAKPIPPRAIARSTVRRMIDARFLPDRSCRWSARADPFGGRIRGIAARGDRSGRRRGAGPGPSADRRRYDALAVAEMAGDKQKTAPDRIVPIGLAARFITSAIVGAALAPRGERLAGAAVAGLTAVASSYVGWKARVTAMDRYGQTATGFIEDAAVLA